MDEGIFNYILDKLQEIWVISSFFAVCHGLLNDKDLHDFEKRMIISKLLGDGLQPPPPGCYGPAHRQCI
jgi:hypothetical protein